MEGRFITARLVKLISTATILAASLTASAYAAVSEGEAKLISQGYTLTNYQFTTEQFVTINTVKVTMLVNATVQPQELATTLKKLKQIIISNAKFDLVSLSQNRTQTGLIQLSAELSSEAPLTTLPSIYQFAEKQSKSGMLYKVSTIVPYLSQEEKQKIANKMSNTLYQQANAYAGNGLPKNSRIAAINYRSPVYINMQQQRPMPIMMAAAVRDTNNESTPMLTMKEQILLTADVTFVSPGDK